MPPVFVAIPLRHERHCSFASLSMDANRPAQRVEIRQTGPLDYIRWFCIAFLILYVSSTILGPGSFVTHFLDGLASFVNGIIMFISFFFGF